MRLLTALYTSYIFLISAKKTLPSTKKTKTGKDSRVTE